MIKKIRDSLSAKVFIWIAGLLILCSLLIYGIVMIILPKSYTTVISTQFVNEMARFVETLADTNYEDASEVIEQFCQNNQATLLLILWIRGRKKEAGILMAIGRSKVEIVLQFLTENILVAIPAAAASFGLTVLLSDKVGAYLVSQTASDVAELSITIYSTDMLTVYGIGALMLILAVLLAAITVVRLKPRMILSEME